MSAGLASGYKGVGESQGRRARRGAVCTVMDKCCPGALPVDRCSGVIVAYAHPASVAVVKKGGGGCLVPSPAQGLHAAAIVVCSCVIW